MSENTNPTKCHECDEPVERRTTRTGRDFTADIDGGVHICPTDQKFNLHTVLAKGTLWILQSDPNTEAGRRELARQINRDNPGG